MKREPLITVLESTDYKAWVKRLDRSQSVMVDARIAQLRRSGSFGNHWVLGGGLVEMKFHNGLRIYCGRQGDKVVVLILGGDKASGRRAQNEDIRSAREMWVEYTKGAL